MHHGRNTEKQRSSEARLLSEFNSTVGKQINILCVVICRLKIIFLIILKNKNEQKNNTVGFSEYRHIHFFGFAVLAHVLLTPHTGHSLITECHLKVEH